MSCDNSDYDPAEALIRNANKLMNKAYDTNHGEDFDETIEGNVHSDEEEDIDALMEMCAELTYKRAKYLFPHLDHIDVEWVNDNWKDMMWYTGITSPAHYVKNKVSEPVNTIVNEMSEVGKIHYTKKANAAAF